MAATFPSNTIFRVAKDVHFKTVKDEAVVIHFVTGNYYVLDPVSAFLWETVSKQAISYDSLVDAVLEEYETDREAILSDVKNFCNYMVTEQLVEIVS